MSHFKGSRLAAAVGLAALLLALPDSASAHETKALGQLHLTIGWGDEPAFSGLKNSISVRVSDAAGAAIADPEASLAAEVSFGEQRLVLTLLPAAGRPGEYHAWLVPTRPGTYTFHITGTVKGQTIDASSTCSEKTFDCVTDIAEVEFPVKDPSTGQLMERITRELSRAERAMDVASSGRKIGIGALAVAAMAFAASIGAVMRKGRKGA